MRAGVLLPMQFEFRQVLKGLVQRLGLMGVAFRVQEWLKSFELSFRRSERLSADDGLPVPPARLIVRVGGDTNARAFLLGGQQIAQTIREMLAADGADAAQMKSILDFGCGSGRVMRQWHALSDRVALHGTDYSRAAIQWCRRNLPFAAFGINRLEPPLDYATNSLDLVYAFSVFTHLSAKLQLAWIGELTRVTAPGGYLFITVHGENFRATLTADEQSTFDSGQLVVRHAGMAGSNLCAAFHPPRYVREILAEHLRIVDYAPARLGQDAILLQKPMPNA